MIYLATPYSHRLASVRQARFLTACRFAAKLINEGVDVFCPIAHSHPIAMYNVADDFVFWQAWDEWFLRRCDSMTVLMLPGWDISLGVASEITLAKELGIEIKYEVCNEL